MSTQDTLPGMDAIVPRQQSGSQALMSIIERAAFDPNFDPSKLTALYELAERARKEESRIQFEEAFQQFKRKAPEIFKTKKVSFPTSGGGRTDYSHAELDKITPVITEALLAVGIVHEWKTAPGLDGKFIVCTCILKGFGHTHEGASLPGLPDTSGGKNAMQGVGSSTSYLQRYTLLATCGLAAKGMDDDGRSAESMSATAIEEYCVTMRDSMTIEELRPVFREAWTKAKALNDRNAQEQLRVVYEARKAEVQ